jgi:glyoxylase-like metal-dependent hydrolase (beta-lactamase superfamily II)
VIPIFLLLTCVTSCARKPDEPPFTLKQAGPNVWAAIDNAQSKASSGANAGFVIGDDGVIVVDTFAGKEAANQLLAEIRKRTKLPLRFVINTHYHFDHVAGNGVFADAGAVVLAQRNVRRWIHTENRRMLTAAAGTGIEVTPEQLADVDTFSSPTAVYDEAIDLYLGSREVHVRSFPGHTGGDSVVLIPDAHVAFAGDLFWRASVPNTIDASTKAWIDTLDNLGKTQSDYSFVPGHGDIGKIQDVAAFRDYLVTLRKLVADAQAQSKSGEAVVDAVIRPLTEHFGQWEFFKYFARPNILEMEAELSGRKRIPDVH